MVVPGDVKPSDGADSDSDDSPRLVSVLVGNVHLAFRERGRARSAGGRRAWDRVIVALLVALSGWMWDSPAGVRDFFGEGGGLQVMMEPITQSIGVDVLVQGLCAFLLGVCYEFNREPGEITRATLYPILHSRIGTDVFIARMARVREDERFKAVGPDSPVIAPGLGLEDEYTEGDGEGEGNTAEGDVWLDWGFVEFWKSNAYTIQRAISVDPDAAAANASMSEEATELIASLKENIRAQAGEMESLQAKLAQMSKEREEERESHGAQIASLTEKVNETTGELDRVRAQKTEAEKEQEDLLVFLEELSSKRKRDKAKMKEAGLEVSEDEGGEDEGEE